MSKEFEPFIIHGTIVRMGDDADGQPRVIVETSREELMRVGNVLFAKVAIVPNVEERKSDE